MYNVLNELKERFQLFAEKKKKWIEIPIELRNHLKMFLTISILIFIGNTLLAFNNLNIFMCGMGYFIFMGILLYTYYLYILYSYEKYLVITGICIDIAQGNTMNKVTRVKDVFFKDASGIVYKFVINEKKKSYIRVGDMINVYAYDDLSVYEKEGIYIITQYHVAQKISINEQLKNKNA